MKLFSATCCLLVCCVMGCASGPYQYGSGWRKAPVDVASADDAAEAVAIEVEEGKPRPIIDGVGWVVGIPGKLLLWNRKVDNHQVSPETRAAVVKYLDDNQMHDVCVRVNQYAPLQEWKRLRENRNVGAGWRYTVGLFSLAGYTVFPGRVFGGDHYNPYTNSLYVYSDVPALAMIGGGYAKDVHSREYPGTYAVVNGFPVVSMWHETIATNDVLTYLQDQDNLPELQAGYKILHPYYGSRVGGAAQSVLGVGPLFQIGGAVVGHVTGRREGRRLEEIGQTETLAQQASRARSKLKKQSDLEPVMSTVDESTGDKLEATSDPADTILKTSAIIDQQD